MDDNEKQRLEQQLSKELESLKKIGDNLKAAKAALRQDLNQLATKNLPLMNEQPGCSGQQSIEEDDELLQNLSQSTTDSQERDRIFSRITGKEETVIQELEPLDLDF